MKKVLIEGMRVIIIFNDNSRFTKTFGNDRDLDNFLSDLSDLIVN